MFSTYLFVIVACRAPVAPCITTLRLRAAQGALFGCILRLRAKVCWCATRGHTSIGCALCIWTSAAKLPTRVSTITLAFQGVAPIIDYRFGLAAVGVVGCRGVSFAAIIHPARGTRRVGERSTACRDHRARSNERLAAVDVIGRRGGRFAAIVHPVLATRRVGERAAAGRDLPARSDERRRLAAVGVVGRRVVSFGAIVHPARGTIAVYECDTAVRGLPARSGKRI